MYHSTIYPTSKQVMYNPQPHQNPLYNKILGKVYPHQNVHNLRNWSQNEFVKSKKQLHVKEHKLMNKNLKHPGYQKRPAHDVFQEDIQLVYRHKKTNNAIFIGNLEAAECIDTLKKHNIGGLLTACRGIHINHSKTHVPHYLYIPGDDHQMFDISVHFDQATNFIKKTLQSTNILVHCMAGISRSVSLVLAYLMKQQGLSFDQAYSQVKRKRKIMNPNRGFIKQLKLLERDQIKYVNQQDEMRMNRSYSSIRRYNKYGNLSDERQRCKSPQPNRNPRHSFVVHQQNNFVSSNVDKPYRYMPENKTIQNFRSSSALKANVPNENNRNSMDYRFDNKQTIKASFFDSSINQKQLKEYQSSNPQPAKHSFKNQSHTKQQVQPNRSISNQFSSYKQYTDLSKQLQFKIQAIKSKYQQYSKQLSQNRQKKYEQKRAEIKNPLQNHNKSIQNAQLSRNSQKMNQSTINKYDFSHFDNFYNSKVNQNKQIQGEQSFKIVPLYQLSTPTFQRPQFYKQF